MTFLRDLKKGGTIGLGFFLVVSVGFFFVSAFQSIDNVTSGLPLGEDLINNIINRVKGINYDSTNKLLQISGAQQISSTDLVCNPTNKGTIKFSGDSFYGCKGTSWAIFEGKVCGDGLLDPGEECDDGNNTNGDGCSNVCVLESLTFQGDLYYPSGGGNTLIGLMDISEEGSFSSTDRYGGLMSMSKSYYINLTGAPGDYYLRYGSSNIKTATHSEGNTYKFVKTGSEIDVYVNSSLIHTFTNATGTYKLVVAAFPQYGGEDLKNVSWDLNGNTTTSTLSQWDGATGSWTFSGSDLDPTSTGALKSINTY